MPFFIISILIQLCLVIHIIKTGRNTIWIWIIVLIPLAGSLAYLLLEILPELTNSRSGRKASNKLRNTINPHKDFKDAAKSFNQSDTVENSVRLADECINKGMFQDARDLYENCLKGVHSDDPDLMYGYAKCSFELENYTESKDTLDRLIEMNPDYKNQEAHLLYARTLEKLDDDISARHEYETLHEYYSGPIASFHFAKFLKSKNENEKAEKIFSEIVEKAKASGRHYNNLYKEYINGAKAELCS